MRVDHAGELGAQGLDLGGVDADAGAAAGEGTSITSKMRRRRDDRRQAARRTRAGFAGARHVGARAAVEQLDAALDGLAAVRGLDGARIGGVGVHELAGCVARPDRRGQRLDQRPQRIGVFAQRL